MLTFEDRCVDLRRSVIDVSTCEIRLLYLLKILILYIAVCELRRGFALQCFHYECIDISQYSSFVLLGDFIIDICSMSNFLFYAYHGFLSLFGLSQVVDCPTHFCNGIISSLID